MAVLPAAAIARVTALVRSAWLRVSACWSRMICCGVGAVASAPMQAMSAGSGGGVVLVVVVVLLGVVVVALLGVVGEGADGRNDAHSASAADACLRSAESLLWAIVTFFWARARPWFAPAPNRPDGLVARALVVGVGVGVTAATAVAAVTAA